MWKTQIDIDCDIDGVVTTIGSDLDVVVDSVVTSSSQWRIVEIEDIDIAVENRECDHWIIDYSTWFIRSI